MSNIYTVNVFLLKRLKFEVDPYMLSFSDELTPFFFLPIYFFSLIYQYFLIQYPQLEVKSNERWLNTFAQYCMLSNMCKHITSLSKDSIFYTKNIGIMLIFCISAG